MPVHYHIKRIDCESPVMVQRAEDKFRRNLLDETLHAQVVKSCLSADS